MVKECETAKQLHRQEGNIRTFSAAAADYCSVLYATEIFCMHFALKILEDSLVQFHKEPFHQEHIFYRSRDTEGGRTVTETYWKIFRSSYRYTTSKLLSQW
jgi:hypothetical protein